MCVIIIKDAGTRIVKKDIENAWLSNPDGAGIAVVDGDETWMSKGYRSADELYDDLRQLQHDDVVIHLRYATHGIKSLELCHPFVISEDTDIATQLYCKTSEQVLCHNGILAGFGDHLESDTLQFVRDVLARLSLEQRDALLSNTQGKFVTVHNGRIEYYGEFAEYKELLVSNLYSFGNRQRFYASDWRQYSLSIDKDEEV